MKKIIPDVLSGVGVALLSYGAWLAYHPAGFMTGGALLVSAAVMLARSE